MEKYKLELERIELRRNKRLEEEKREIDNRKKRIQDQKDFLATHFLGALNALYDFARIYAKLMYPLTAFLQPTSSAANQKYHHFGFKGPLTCRI